MTHAKKGEAGGVCDPQVFCTSKNPSFLARWRVRGRPAVRGPAGTGSVGDGVGEGAARKLKLVLGLANRRKRLHRWCIAGHPQHLPSHSLRHFSCAHGRGAQLL